MQFSAPHGPAWVFFGVVFVIAVFPWLAERVRVPGIIGLLLGGLLLGQNGLGIVPAGDLVIPAVGHIGLLYLMFLAGVELDNHDGHGGSGKEEKWREEQVREWIRVRPGLVVLFLAGEAGQGRCSTRRRAGGAARARRLGRYRDGGERRWFLQLGPCDF